MIKRAVTAHTTLVIVSPMLVPHIRWGSFPLRPSTTSPLRTKWSTMHSDVTTRKTNQTKASYEIVKGRLLRPLLLVGFWDDGIWSSGISIRYPCVWGDLSSFWLWRSSRFFKKNWKHYFTFRYFLAGFLYITSNLTFHVYIDCQACKAINRNLFLSIFWEQKHHNQHEVNLKHLSKRQQHLSGMNFFKTVLFIYYGNLTSSR